MTRLIIIRDSAPLVGAQIRIEGDPTLLQTDDDGMVNVDGTPTEPFDVEICDGDIWITRTIEPRESRNLVVLDLSKRPTTDELLGGPMVALGERYSFVKVLGRGGMGVVIQAEDTVLQRQVAIKMLNDELQANEEARRILLTEGQALARLNHPHLVDVFDVASEGDRVMMVMEFVDGKNLDVHIQDGALDQHLAVRTSIQLVAALQYLHDEEYVHRDIKPANCIMLSNGDVKLIDFGLARSLDHIIQRGTRVRGSPAYMAPEQLEGTEITPATDVYQMGVSMFELVTGDLPFSGASLAYSHVHLTPPRADEVAEELDAALVDLIDDCLKKNPAERPSTSEVAERLRAIDASLSNPDRPVLDRAVVDVDDDISSPDAPHAEAPPTISAKRGWGVPILFLVLLTGLAGALAGALSPGESVPESPTDSLKTIGDPQPTNVANMPIGVDAFPPARERIERGLNDARRAKSLAAESEVGALNEDDARPRREDTSRGDSEARDVRTAEDGGAAKRPSKSGADRKPARPSNEVTQAKEETEKPTLAAPVPAPASTNNHELSVQTDDTTELKPALVEPTPFERLDKAPEPAAWTATTKTANARNSDTREEAKTSEPDAKSTDEKEQIEKPRVPVSF